MKTRLFVFISFISSVAWSQVYESRAKCDAAFKASQPKSASSSEANEKFCFGKYTLSADEMKWVNCVEEQMRKSYGANYNVNDNVGKLARSNFKAMCLRINEHKQALTTQQKQAAQAQQQAAADVQKKSNQAANGGIAPGSALGTAMQLAPVAIQMYGQMNKDDKDKEVKKPSSSEAPFGGNVANSVNRAIAQTNQNTTPSPSQTTSESSSQMNHDDFRRSEISQRNASESSLAATNSGPVTREDVLKKFDNTPTEMISESPEGAQQVITNLGTEIKAAHSDLGKPIDQISSAPDKPLESVPPTQITSVDQGQSKEFANGVNSTLQSTPLPDSGYVNYRETKTMLSEIPKEVSQYINELKDACTKSGERASKLCVEGTSPGAKAAKMLLDFSGPVLGALSSAQKTCSSTNKIMSYATAGLTIAKGVCVASKLMCDSSCSSATKKIKEIQLKAQQTQQMAQMDYIESKAKCDSLKMDQFSRAAGIACEKTNNLALNIATTKISELQKIIQKENSLAEGTSLSRAAGCESHAKDIALLAANIGSTLLAAKSAKKCSDQLSSNPNGSGITTAQMCEQPGNTELQVCKCERNNNSEGCPGYVASNNGGGSKQLQSNSYRLPTGSSNGGPTTTSNGSKTGGGITDPKDSSSSSDPSGTGGVNSGFAGVGGGSGTGTGSAETASGLSDGESDIASNDKKKNSWGFGSLGGFASGLFGGSGKIDSKLGLGANSDAIKRKIASEQLRAEVSTASGKSNWEKVRNMYIMKNPTFFSGK